MIKTLSQAARLALIGIAPLLLLEGGLRLAGWPTDRVRNFSKLLNFDEASWKHAVGVFRPGARSTVLWPPELAYRVHINALGLRGPEIERTPPTGRTRILALGDSMTFGYHLEEEETWPAQLEASLRRRGLDIEVVNAGSGGWSIESETRFWLERAHSLEPDYVVLTFYANDLRELARSRPVYRDQKRNLGSRARRWTHGTATYEAYLRLQVRWNRFRREWSGGISAIPNEDPGPGDVEALWTEYASWLDRLLANLDSRGIPLVLAYVPDAYKLQNGLSADDEVRLRELAQDREIPLATPLPRFKQSPVTDLFHVPIDKHLSAAGARALAEAIEEVMAPRLMR